MTELIDTTEMYLRTIFELEEEGVPVLRARIAERLAHSGPTVSQTVARMERDGLLRVSPNRSLELSAEGRARAVRVMRKHRLAERLLLDVIGLEYEHVHAEACRWEHVMSDRVERKIIALLSTFHDSPYGNPIPGLGELGVAEQETTVRAGLQPLSELAVTEPCAVIVRRLGEPVQDDVTAMGLLHEAGVVAGQLVTVRRDAEAWAVARAAPDDIGEVRLGAELAAHVFVSLPR